MALTYTDLHLHSEYSLKDGMIRVVDIEDPDHVKAQMILAAESRNTGAVTCTDHGNMYAHAWLAFAAHTFGLKHIPGCEFYIAPEGKTRHDKNMSKGQSPYRHICAWARNKQGYANMCILSNLSYAEGFYYNPRIDLELADKYGDGIIWSDACMGGILSGPILDGNYVAAMDMMNWFMERFKDDFYIEVQNHHIQSEEQANKIKIEWANARGIPIIATTDSHYFVPDDKEAHRTLLAIQYGGWYDDPSFHGFDGDGYHILTEAELLDRFPTEYLNNTQLIVDKVEPDIMSFGKVIPPTFQVPDSFRRIHE